MDTLEIGPGGYLLQGHTDRAKLSASLILFVTTLICGYLPVKVILNQDYVQYAIFTGGGVLMATAFCHLIPETHDNFKLGAQSNQDHLQAAPSTLSAEYKTSEILSDSGIEIPYVEILLCSGFFFMYVVEQLFANYISSHTHDHLGDSRNVTDSSIDLEGGNSGRVPAGGGRSIRYADSATTMPSGLYKFFRGLLIISAFIVHSIFDGVAIGSQSTSERVWEVFIAISCHKLVIAAVLGLELFGATLKSHFWTLVHLSIFSLMSPLGIILVVIAEDSFHLKEDDPRMVLTQAFATGTLIYIIFIEILQPKGDRAPEKNALIKNLCLIGGFVVMVTILTLMDEG